eukprot:224472-Hanusia_phi.AAC.4
MSKMRDDYAAWCKDNPDALKLETPLIIAQKIETPKKEPQRTSSSEFKSLGAELKELEQVFRGEIQKVVNILSENRTSQSSIENYATRHSQSSTEFAARSSRADFSDANVEYNNLEISLENDDTAFDDKVFFDKMELKIGKILAYSNDVANNRNLSKFVDSLRRHGNQDVKVCDQILCLAWTSSGSVEQARHARAQHGNVGSRERAGPSGRSTEVD